MRRGRISKDKTRPDETRQDNIRRDKTRQDKTRINTRGEDKANHEKSHFMLKRRNESGTCGLREKETWAI